MHNSRGRRGSFHTHTIYSDGKSTPEQMVLAALEKGLPALGFSDHGPAPYDQVAMAPQAFPRYKAEIAALKQRYAGQIEIYTGIEYDAYVPFDGEGLDYIIGSVHYARCPQTGRTFALDHRPEDFMQAVETVGNGSAEQLLARYWDTVADMAQRQQPHILAHLDLPVKLNRGGAFFDESSPWYRKQEEDAARRLACLNPLVEVNTGGIYRGWRQNPYPSRHLLELFYELGVPLILSSDAHEAKALDFGFDLCIDLLRSIGYRSVKTLSNGRFIDTEL